MIRQYHHNPLSGFVLVYQNHLIAPECAFATAYKTNAGQVYPMSIESMIASVMHFERAAATQLFGKNYNGHPESWASLSQQWEQARIQATDNFNSWLLLHEQTNTLRMYTPSEVIVTLDRQGVQVMNEYVQAPLPAENQRNAFVMCSQYVPILPEVLAVLNSNILTAKEVANRLVPRIAQNLPPYTAIQLPFGPDQDHSVISANPT